MQPSGSKPWYRSRLVDWAVRLLYYCGLLHLIGLWRKYWGRKRLVILLYHRVVWAEQDATVGGLCLDSPVRADQFRAHLRLLRWFGEPLPLQRAFRLLHQPRQRPRTLISVTFDDGYRDNFAVARPLWNRYGVPVTLFPAIEPIEGRQWLWWDELQHIVGTARQECRALREAAENLTRSLCGSSSNGAVPSQASPQQVAQYLFERLAPLPVDRRRAALAELRARLTPNAATGNSGQGHGCGPRPDELYLSWEQVQAMAAEGVQFGGHTVCHPRLTVEPVPVAAAEIAGCRSALQRRTGQSVSCFAAPGGFQDRRIQQLIAEAGYELAVTVEKGVNYADSDPYRLKRLCLSWDEAHHLAFKLAFADWLYPS